MTMRHFFKALRDVIYGLRAGTDKPLSKYKVELAKDSESKKIRLGSKADEIRIKLEGEKNKNIRIQTRNLRRANATKDAFERKVKKKKEQLERKHSLLVQSKTEFELANSDYQIWRNALGRPPFRTQYKSLYDQIRYKFHVKEGGPGKVSEITSDLDLSTIVGALPRRVAALLMLIISLIVVPFDIYYSFPGFKLILEDPKYAGAAAFLLGLILASVGATLGILFQLIHEKKVCGHKIESSIRKNFLALFVLSLLIGLAVIYAGATIRSIVPEANSIVADSKDIASRLSIIQSSSLVESTVTDRNVELQTLENREKVSKQKIDELRKIALPRFTADALIAFCFYGFAVLSIMIARITSQDPVLEYHLATINRDSAQRAMLFFENEVEEGLGIADGIVAAADAEIENLENTIEDIRNEEDIDKQLSLTKSEIEAIEADEKERIKRDALVYAKAFSFFTRDREILREWEELFDA